MEKIYVAVGDDLQEGLKTLEWALRKWPPANNPMMAGIVILHVTQDISKDFVYSPFGKLPASSVSEKVLEHLKKQEQDKIDNLLVKYVAFCGKVKAKVEKLEKPDEPIFKLLVDVISRLHITKLVIDLNFVKSSSSSSWKSRGAIRRLFYIHHHKPDYCELYIVGGGKLLHLREEDADGVIDDGQVLTMSASTRGRLSFKGWLGKIMFPEYDNAALQLTNRSDHHPPSQWEDHVQEIENYFQQLQKASFVPNNDNFVRQTNPDLQVPELPLYDTSGDSKAEALKRRVEVARLMIKERKTEVEAHLESRIKTERVIHLCNRRILDLQTRIEEETAIRVSLQKDLEADRKQLRDIVTEGEESKRRLDSLVQVHAELSNKLRTSMISKGQAEARLENTELARAEITREIEELRRQRDVLRRRIEFCRERDDMIGSEVNCGYREYTTEDIRLATGDFAEHLRIKSASYRTNIYRGHIDHATTVAVKMCGLSGAGLSPEAFHQKVRLLSEIRHPHLVAILGFCVELNCVIFEYMHNGSLQDILHSMSRRSNKDFMWLDRLRVAHEISLGLGWLHSAKLRPVAHGRLTPSSILFDRNLVAKLDISGFLECPDEYAAVKSNVRALGRAMLQLLIGTVCAGLFEEAEKMDWQIPAELLDKRAGGWPVNLAEGFGKVAMRCVSIRDDEPEDSWMDAVIQELGAMRREAETQATVQAIQGMISYTHRTDESRHVPNGFLCPIFQDVMNDPHVAADGFSYELEAIQEWLWTGHDTSPMTNLRLDHKFLTPNRTLCSLIRNWQSQRSSGMSPSPGRSDNSLIRDL